MRQNQQRNRKHHITENEQMGNIHTVLVFQCHQRMLTYLMRHPRHVNGLRMIGLPFLKSHCGSSIVLLKQYIPEQGRDRDFIIYV